MVENDRNLRRLIRIREREMAGVRGESVLWLSGITGGATDNALRDKGDTRRSVFYLFLRLQGVGINPVTLTGSPRTLQTCYKLFSI